MFKPDECVPVPLPTHIVTLLLGCENHFLFSVESLMTQELNLKKILFCIRGKYPNSNYLEKSKQMYLGKDNSIK